jgi:hypothetical protein
MEETPNHKKFIVWLKKHWLTFSFILGFFTDLMLLNQIDNLADNLILLFYASLATVSLLLFYIGIAQRVPVWFSQKFVRFMPTLMQYSFGGLLSGMLIFYGRSGDIMTSAPFLLIILFVIFGNELVHKRSDRLVYHLALYFIGIFSYIVLVLPVLFRAMGDLMFFLSGLVALIFVTIVIQTLHRIVPNFMAANIRRVILVIGAIYASLNILYFTGVIPPIPLSLKQLEVVHLVVPVNNTYRLTTENQPWWRELPLMLPVLHPGSSLSCFARVYAPTRLSTEIYHRWEYKDVKGNWVERGRIEYPIIGSNKGGYRGYTTVSNIQSGVWRCSVETKRGQVLGRQTVKVEAGVKAVDPVTRIE